MANGVTIDLIVDPKKAIAGLGEVERKSSSVAGVLGGLGHAAAIGIAALGVAAAAAAAATTAFIVSSAKAAAEAEKITAQTAAVLKSTGGAAGKSATQIDTLAKSLSEMSGISKETIKSSENVLLTFTAIRGVNFNKAQTSILDLSQALGKDLQSATVLVGKALNDPIKGLTALTRVGVQFTAQQKAQIAGFIKVGDVASAQGVILDVLNTKFGGSAAAFGNTFLGSVGRAKTALQELKDEIGAAFLPALTAAAGSVATVLNAVTDNPKFKAFLDGLGAKLTNGLKPFTDLLASVASSPDPFGTLATGLEKISPAFTVIRDVFDAIKPSLPILQKEFADLGAAIGAGLAQYGPQLATAFGEIVTAIVPLIPQILTLIPPLLQLALQVIPPLVDVLTILIPPLDFIVQAFAGGLQTVSAFFNFLAGNTTLQGWLDQLRSIQGPVGDMFKFLQDAGANIGNFLHGIGTGIRDFFSNSVGWLIDAGKNIIQGLINGISGAVGGVLSFVRSIGKNIANAFAKALGIKSPSTIFAGFGGNIIAGLQSGLAGPNNLGQIMSGISSQVTNGFQGSIAATARATVTTSASSSGGGAVAVVDPESRTLMRTLIKAVGNIQPGFIVPESLAQINSAGSSRLATVGAS